jgi:hypothetical protein
VAEDDRGNKTENARQKTEGKDILKARFQNT